MKKYYLLCLTMAMIGSAAVRKVPAEYTTIQSAINASVNGDTVVVSPGTYFENINYRGKNIVLTSRFYEKKDISFIYSTVINGSKPSHPDTASVVLFINHEDSTAVLQGFTLTGGAGTAWPDEHSVGTFTEGGGILCAFSAPRILSNLIINNEAIFKRNGIVSGGGGGIRLGDGNPYIANNVFMNNKGRYGTAVVMNYSGATFRNNIVVGNSGGGEFDGGAVWLNGSGAKPKYIENNTIIGNHATSISGGLVFTDPDAAASVRNNIIWGNIGSGNTQVSLGGLSTAGIDFNDIENGLTGANNLSVPPAFMDSMALLQPSSALIDAGDSSLSYNDPGTGASAVFPSRGTLRNDMGAYGGPYAAALPVLSLQRFAYSASQISFGKIRPDSVSVVRLRLYNTGILPHRIDSVRFARNVMKNVSASKTGPLTIAVGGRDSIILQWHPLVAENLNDTLFIYHNDTSVVRPLAVALSGKAFSIEKASAGVMYAGSGTTDSAKFYSIDTSKAAVNLIGRTGFSQIISVRVDPKTKELIALVNSATPQLMRISATTAESFPLPQLVMTNPKGMVFRPDGTLLIGTFSGTVYSVNMSTGAVTSVGSNGLRISGLAFNPVNGSLWMSVRPPSSGKDNIYKVNPSTMQATLVGTTGFGISTKDITFSANGRLFGVLDTAGAQSYLIQIDTVTAKGTVIGGLTVKGLETIELQSSFVTSVDQHTVNVPSEFSLAQNFPNPFNPSTTIRFSLRSAGPATMKVYDILGKEIATVVQGYLPAGDHRVSFDAGRLASGIYFYSLRSGNDIQTKKMTVLK